MDDFSSRKPAPPPTPEEIPDWIAKAKAAAANADVVIAGMGETASMSGEAASRSTLDLPGIQEQMLEAVTTTDNPVILVLEGGRLPDIRWAAEHVPAILEASYPGTEGGGAVADVLFGDVNPGGELPVSYSVFKFANLQLSKTSMGNQFIPQGFSLADVFMRKLSTFTKVRPLTIQVIASNSVNDLSV
jgi:hypothetical protein